MRAFQSEAKRVVRDYGLGAPGADQLGDALCWALFATGHLKKRRHRGHGRAWRQRAICGGSYETRPR